MDHPRARWSALVWAGLCCQLLACHLVFPFDVGGNGEDSRINTNTDSIPDTAKTDAPGSPQDKSIDRGNKPIHDQKPMHDENVHDQKLPPDQKQPADGGGISGQCSDETKWGCKTQMSVCTYSCPTGASSKLYTIMCTTAGGGSCSCFDQNLQPLPCSYIPLSTMNLCDMCTNAFDNGCCTK